jgi:hypothetical protein
MSGKRTIQDAHPAPPGLNNPKVAGSNPAPLLPEGGAPRVAPSGSGVDRATATDS